MWLNKSVKLQVLQRVKFANISIYRHTPREAAPQSELRKRERGVILWRHRMTAEATVHERLL